MPDGKTFAQKRRISTHLKDLLGRDVSVLLDIVTWLKPTKRDIARRAINKRLAARYAAAKMILEATENGNSGLFTHILDRTEGKVQGDELVPGSVHYHFNLIAGGRGGALPGLPEIINGTGQPVTQLTGPPPPQPELRLLDGEEE